MPDAAPRRLALLALVSARFYGDGPHPLQLVCTTEDASDVECDQTIAEVEPGAEWDELEARIVAHAAEYHATGLEAAAPPDATFEDMLADPGEQFDPRSELLASIAAYAAAPSDTPSAAPRPLTAPDVVAGLLADVAERDERLADVSAQLAEAKGNLARCAEEATAPVLYQAYVSGLHVTALRAGSHRDAVIASTPPYEQLGMEQQAGWNGVVVKTLQIARAWDWSAQVSQLRAELATCRERNAAIAVQSDQYRDDRDDARSAFAKLAGRFTQGAQSGWTARISGTVLRRLCVMAMCEPPSGSEQATDVRPRAGEPGWLDVTCGGCGEEFGTNFAVGELECPECEARRCPACEAWFGGAP